MCVTATAKRKRKQARLDKRYVSRSRRSAERMRAHDERIIEAARARAARKGGK